MNKFTIDSLRVVCGVYAMITALGLVWFAGSLNAYWNTYALVTFIAFIVGASTHAKAYQSKYRYTIAGLYALAVILTFPILYFDLTLINGADSPAMMIRSVGCLVLGILAGECIKKSTRS
jgi:hypothetical protein